jgi:hypothetical protein
MRFILSSLLVFLISCASKGPQLSGEESAKVRGLLADYFSLNGGPKKTQAVKARSENRKALESLEWNKFETKAEAHEVLAEKVGEGASPYTLGLPTFIFQEKDLGSWMEYLGDQIASCEDRQKSTLKINKCVATQSLLQGLVSSLLLAPERLAKDGSFESALSKLKDSLALVYSDWSLSYSIKLAGYKYPHFDHAFFLEMAAWLNDLRALKVAERGLASLAGQKDPLAISNAQVALIAVTYYLDGPESVRAKALLQKSVQDKSLPKDLKKAIESLLQKKKAVKVKKKKKAKR